MLTRLIPTPAPEHRRGTNQMRQQVTIREHFRRRNAPVSDNQLYISWWNMALPQEAPVKPEAAEGAGRNAALRQRL
jgi:hypothetical protein